MHPEETAAAPVPQADNAPPPPAAAPDTPPPTAAPVPAAEADNAPPTAANEDAGAGAAAAAPGLSPAECGTRLAALFPALFVAPGAPGPFKPIKLRIHSDILARAPGVFSKRVLGIFFSRYTTSNAYLKALSAPDAQRFDLDGAPAGEIAEEHRAAAVEELARRRAIAAERRSAQRPAAPARQEAPAATGGPAAREPQRPARDRPGRREAPRRGDGPGARRPRPHDAPRAHPPREHPPREHPPRATPAPPAGPPPAAAVPADPAQRERALLLRAYESSPLSKANFCALKRISEADLDRLLAEAQPQRSAR